MCCAIGLYWLSILNESVYMSTSNSLTIPSSHLSLFWNFDVKAPFTLKSVKDPKKLLFIWARMSLTVQWLRLCASNAGGQSLIPGQRTKIPHATWLCQKSYNY